MKTSKQLAKHYLDNILGGRKGLDISEIVDDEEIEQEIASDLENFIEGILKFGKNLENL